MAKHYALGNDSGTIRRQIASALQDYYGAGVTIHYSSSNDIIFSCSAISDKVVRVNFSYTSWYYGDSYVSGTTISNPVQFAEMGISVPTQAELVLADKFMLLLTWHSGSGYALTLVGEMTNGDFCVAGFIQTTGTYYNMNHTYNTTQDRELKAITWNTGFKDANGKLYKQPLMFAAINGSLELNGSNPATIAGVYNVSGPRNPGQATVGPDYLITPTDFSSRIYGLTGSVLRDLYTPLYVEFSSSVNWRG